MGDFCVGRWFVQNHESLTVDFPEQVETDLSLRSRRGSRTTRGWAATTVLFYFGFVKQRTQRTRRVSGAAVPSADRPHSLYWNGWLMSRDARNRAQVRCPTALWLWFRSSVCRNVV